MPGEGACASEAALRGGASSTRSAVSVCAEQYSNAAPTPDAFVASPGRQNASSVDAAAWDAAQPADVTRYAAGGAVPADCSPALCRPAVGARGLPDTRTSRPPS